MFLCLGIQRTKYVLRSPVGSAVEMVVTKSGLRSHEIHESNPTI